MPKCKGCGASIVFVRTPNGKSMPCDETMVPYIERRGANGKIVTADGKVVSAEVTDDLGSSTGVGYVPHWATCPKAVDFKRK